jgi:hypothetical protein
VTSLRSRSTRPGLDSRDCATSATAVRFAARLASAGLVHALCRPGARRRARRCCWSSGKLTMASTIGRDSRSSRPTAARDGQLSGRNPLMGWSSVGRLSGGPTVNDPPRWVSSDLCRRRSQITIIDERGVDAAQAIPTGRQRSPGRSAIGESTHVALEATYSRNGIEGKLDTLTAAIALLHGQGLDQGAAWSAQVARLRRDASRRGR